jgi:hypothetical protein
LVEAEATVKLDQRVSRVECTGVLSGKGTSHIDFSTLRPTLDQAINVCRQCRPRTASNKKICDRSMTFIWSPDEVIPRYQAKENLKIISRKEVASKLIYIVS